MRSKYLRRCANRAKQVLANHYDPSCKSASVTDLLTDLGHYCDAENIDFRRCLDLAYMNYEAEKTGD